MAAKCIFLLIAHKAFREAVARVWHDQPDLEVVSQAGSLADLDDADHHHNADITLVDPSLSDGDGMAVVRQVSSDDTDAVALVMTTLSDPRLIERASEAGAARVLHTSSSLEEIVEAIRSSAREYERVPTTTTTTRSIQGRV